MYKLKDKASNLDILKKVFKKDKNIVIPLYFYFSVRNFNKNKEKILKRIFLFNKGNSVILRSSSVDEDKSNLSNAGKYDSKIIEKKTSYNEIKKILLTFLKQFQMHFGTRYWHPPTAYRQHMPHPPPERGWLERTPQRRVDQQRREEAKVRRPAHGLHAARAVVQ